MWQKIIIHCRLVTSRISHPFGMGDGMTVGQPGGPPAVRSARYDTVTAHRQHRQIDVNVAAVNKDDIISHAKVLAAPGEVVAADDEDMATNIRSGQGVRRCLVSMNIRLFVGDKNLFRRTFGLTPSTAVFCIGWTSKMKLVKSRYRRCM